MLSFSKYHGTGNDFVMINNLAGEIKLTHKQISLLCDRNFGVGADGVILIESSVNAAFHMNYYNSDGSQSFCGNGSRCAVHFADSLGIAANDLTFEAIDGVHQAAFSQDQVRIKMGDTGFPSVEKGGYFLNTGSPHVVVYKTNLQIVSVVNEGQAIRYSDQWKAEGTNVNFVLREANYLSVRTYERGVENETLSCGTGVTAVALVDAFLNGGEARHIQTLGGRLELSFKRTEKGFESIWMSGPATKVFDGKINIEE
ncbi:MAG: diaminopimelate epimerase [Flavobacteriales bacterium]|jgi:diaminopimelate epimerase